MNKINQIVVKERHMTKFCRFAAACAVAMAGFNVSAEARTSLDYVQDGLVAHWDGCENSGRLDHRDGATSWVDLVKGVEVAIPEWVTVEDHSLLSTGPSGSATHTATQLASIEGLSPSDAVWTIEIVQQSCGWTKTDNYENLQNVVNTQRGTLGYRKNAANGFYFFGPSSATQCSAQNWLHATAKVADLHTMSAVQGTSKDTCSIWMDGVQDTVNFNGGYTANNPTVFSFFGNARMSIRVYAIRIYNRKLTQAEVAANHAVDVARFVNGECAQSGVVVENEPVGVGSANPAAGLLRPDDGETVVCTADAAWMNTEETVRADCVGWKFYDIVSGKLLRSSTDGGEQPHAFSHTYAKDEAVRLVWQWSVQKKVAVTAVGGTVTGSGWYGAGESVALTATPDAGVEFRHWEGDVAAEKAHDPELVFTMGDAPVSLRAVFGSSVYVSQPSGGDDYATIQAAIDNAGSWGKVSLARGTWKISKALAVTNDVTLVGETGDPEDVCITTTKKDAAFATVKGGTVSGIAFHGAWGTQKPALSLLAGGVATNCIVRSCEVTGGGNDACAVTLNGADALMTHCVVSNNVNSAGPGNGMARACGGVHVENGTLAWSLVAGNRETYSAVYQKGGVFLKDGLVLNCTVVNNRGPGCGGIAIEDAFAANGIVSNCVIAANVASLSGTSVNAYQTKSDRYSHYCNCLSDSSAPNATCGQAAAYNIFRDLAHGDYRGNVGFSTLNGQTVGCYPVPDGELVAGFSATAVSGTLPLEVTLTAAVSGAQGPVSYSWDLDGDGIYEDTASGETVVCNLQTAGSRSVGLKVSDGAHVAELFRPDFITALPQTLYVKKGNANAAFPYDTEEKAAAEIQTAVDAAIDGCTVCLLADTYTVTAPVTVDKGVTLCGQTGDPDDVVLTCGTKAQSAVKLNHRLARIEGVTVTGATGACAGAIYLNNLGGTASNCIVRGCVFSGGLNDGAAIYATSADSLVTHCVVSNNSISTGCSNGNGRKCAGIVLWSGAKASNCLVANCKYTDSPNDYSPGGIYAKDSYVYNCTVVDCVGTACGGIWSDNSGGIYNSVIAGCNANKKGSGYHSIYSGTGARFHNCAADTEVINATCKKDEANNLFKGYASGNYAPKVGSVLIGNGDPAISVLPEKDLAGNARLSDEGAIDIGAYQSKVEFGVGLKSVGTEFLAPCSVKFEAEVGGVPAEDEIVYEWTVGKEVTEENSAVKFVDFTTAGDVTVIVRAYDSTIQMWSTPSDPVSVHVVPKTIWVNPGNEHAAQPYASKATGAADLQTVLDYAVGGCEILIARGTHALTVDTSVEKPVTLRGETDDPADVVFRPQSGILPFVLKADGAVLANVTVEGLTGSGTAIKVDDLGGTVSNCVVRSCCISANRGDYDRTSVLAAIGRLARVTRCVITNNTCTASPPNTNGRRGPGLSLQSGAWADNCLIACNSNLTATTNLHLPGGVYIDNGVLVNCTVVDNYGRATGGVWIDNMFGGGVVGSVTNCVMAGNSCKAAANDANFLAAKTDGGATGFIALTAKPVACATDTVKLGDDSIVGTMQEFFRLKRSRPYSLLDKSPLRDAGVDVNLPIDLLGNSRPFGRRYDIGCYESQISGFILMVR